MTMWGACFGGSIVVAYSIAERIGIAEAPNAIATILIFAVLGVFAESIRRTSRVRRTVAWVVFGSMLASLSLLGQVSISAADLIAAPIAYSCYFGFLGEFSSRLLPRKPRYVESLTFSWPGARVALPGACLAGVAFGTSFSTVNAVGAGDALVAGLVHGLLFGLVVGVTCGIALGFKAGLANGPISVRPRPFASMWRSVWSGVAAGALGCAAAGSRFFVSGLPEGVGTATVRAIAWGMGAGVLGAFAGGFSAVTQYWLARTLIWTHGLSPLRLHRWLEYSVRLRLLYRSNGGYVFIHRMLLDCMAEDAHPPKQDTGP